MSVIPNRITNSSRSAIDAQRTHGSRDWANAGVWTAQVLLAALFLFTGTMKFFMSVEDMNMPFDLPLAFLRFIGTMEVLGALGLILPGLTGIRRALTPLAAAGLVVIMIGATALTVAAGDVGPAIVPFTLGLVAATIAYGRRSWLSSDAA